MKSQQAQAAGAIQDTGCCPRFDPAPWQDHLITWDQKPFVRDRVHSVLHVPLDFGKVMARNLEAIGDAVAPDRLVLCNENSAWSSDVLLAVTHPVPGRKMTAISGTFLSTVYEGSYRQVGEFTDAAVTAAKRRGIPADRVYFWYPTCPKCAKAYGENYMVIFVG